MSAPNFEEDHFDFPEPVVSGPSSYMTTSLEMVKSVVLSRPFLLALIAFLSYRLLITSSAKPHSHNASENRRSSIVPERVSVRKSQRPLPSIVPPVTMAKK
jgi:hypothetical protein